MNVVRPIAVRNILKITSASLIVIVCSAANAESPADAQNGPGFQKTKFPKIQVRHMPLPKTDKERQVPAKGTPRTELPVVNAPGPKGGKMIRVDNTYLVQCPPPGEARASDAPAAPKAE